MTARSYRQEARERIAAEIERNGPTWKRLADQVRGGFENLWLKPALDALERTVRDPMGEDD